MKSMDKIQLLSLLIVALFAVSIVLLLIPCVNYGAGTASAMNLVLTPNGSPELKEYLGAQIEGYKVNAAVGTPLAILILGIITIATRAIHSGNCSILPLLLSGFCLYSLLGNPFMKLTPFFVVWIILLALIVVLSVIAFALSIIKKRKLHEFYVDQAV